MVSLSYLTRRVAQSIQIKFLKVQMKRCPNETSVTDQGISTLTRYQRVIITLYP